MKQRSNGFSTIEAMLVVAVFVIIGLVGYNLYSMQQARQQQTATLQHQAAEAPATINSQADIEASATALDETVIDNEADTSALEQDISQL